MSRLTIATSAQADASGGVVFDGFGAPGTGTAWVVTAAVPLAPGTASFQAWRTTEVWASWLGSAAGGPLLVTGSQRLIVKGTSLAKTAIYRCVLTGQSMPETTAQGVSVAPISSSTLTKTTLTGKVTVGKITSPVTLASGTSVDVASGTINLEAGASVAVNAGQLSSTGIPLQATAPQLLVTTFGTGTTGTVTISASATLTQKAYYNALTINVGVVLTAPWIVYCKTQATLNGTLANSGYTPTGTLGGAGGLKGSFFGGGAGGSAVATKRSGSPPAAATWNGGSGGKGRAGTGSATTTDGGTAPHPLTTPLIFGSIGTASLSGGGGGGADLKTHGGGGGGGVVMLAAKVISGAGNVVSKGGDGVRVSATDYSGAGGGGIGLVYSHTAATWTGKVTIAAGTTTTTAAASGQAGSHVVRRKFTGALYP